MPVRRSLHLSVFDFNNALYRGKILHSFAPMFLLHSPRWERKQTNKIKSTAQTQMVYFSQVGHLLWHGHHGCQLHRIFHWNKYIRHLQGLSKWDHFTRQEFFFTVDHRNNYTFQNTSFLYITRMTVHFIFLIWTKMHMTSKKNTSTQIYHFWVLKSSPGKKVGAHV